MHSLHDVFRCVHSVRCTSTGTSQYVLYAHLVHILYEVCDQEHGYDGSTHTHTPTHRGTQQKENTHWQRDEKNIIIFGFCSENRRHILFRCTHFLIFSWSFFLLLLLFLHIFFWIFMCMLLPLSLPMAVLYGMYLLWLYSLLFSSLLFSVHIRLQCKNNRNWKICTRFYNKSYFFEMRTEWE